MLERYRTSKMASTDLTSELIALSNRLMLEDDGSVAHSYFHVSKSVVGSVRCCWGDTYPILYPLFSFSFRSVLSMYV